MLNDSESLTERELQTLQLSAEGLKNPEIALHLGITERTVLHHMGSAKKKLGCRTRTQAVALAIKSGLIG